MRSNFNLRFVSIKIVATVLLRFRFRAVICNIFSLLFSIFFIWPVCKASYYSANTHKEKNVFLQIVSFKNKMNVVPCGFSFGEKCAGNLVSYTPVYWSYIIITSAYWEWCDKLCVANRLNAFDVIEMLKPRRYYGGWRT